MKRSRLLIAALCLMIVGSVAAFLWPQKPLDLSKDEEPFSSIAMPPLKVDGTWYMDGGSVTVRIIDQKHVCTYITFPIERTSVTAPYPNAFHGFLDPSMTPLKNSTRAREIAIRLLRDYSDLTYNDIAADQERPNKVTLDMLSNHPQMAAERAWHKVGNLFH